MINSIHGRTDVVRSLILTLTPTLTLTQGYRLSGLVAVHSILIGWKSYFDGGGGSLLCNNTVELLMLD